MRPPTWDRLVELNRAGASLGHYQTGVFATGVGSEFSPDSGILYVGKSAGPLGGKVGSVFDQKLSGIASANWMAERRNLSPFWQMIDRFDPARRRFAWTNVSKMDRANGTAPAGAHWVYIRDACVKALEEEISVLRPQVSLFATSDAYR